MNNDYFYFTLLILNSDLFMNLLLMNPFRTIDTHVDSILFLEYFTQTIKVRGIRSFLSHFKLFAITEEGFKYFNPFIGLDYYFLYFIFQD